MKALPLFFTVLFSCLTIESRSPHRLPEKNIQCLTVCSPDNPTEKSTFTNSYLQEIMFKHFDEALFAKRTLPESEINYRYNPTHYVSGAHLGKLVEELIAEIKSYGRNDRIKDFTHFSILKIQDVNMKDKTGLYVLKFKDYPFILKLSIETLQSFVRPTDKGFVPTCLFYMAGGMSRHLTGFTRITNLDDVRQLVEASPRWRDKVAFPRKWFWLPQNPHWIDIHGQNIGPKGTVHAKIPGTYAVICDEIIWSRPFKLTNSDDKKIIIDFSNFLDQRLDLHINNFGIEQGTDKITPIDFEYFPAVVGLEKGERKCNGYFQWYSTLSCKMLRDLMFRTKKRRRHTQYRLYVHG